MKTPSLLVLLAVATAVPALAQDPVKVDPRHYKLEFEDEQIRVLRIRFAPREKSVMHEHPMSSCLVRLTAEQTRHTAPDGKVTDSRGNAGSVECEALMAGTSRHLPENMSDRTVELILIERKVPQRPSGGAMQPTSTVSSATSAQCPEGEKATLREFDRAWGDATIRGDRSHLQTVYADDYAGASLTGTLGKGAAVDNAVQQAERNRANPQGAPRLSYDNYIITCTANTATVTHRNVATTTVSGREQTTYSRSVHVLEKRGGRWHVVGNAGHGLDDAAVLLYMESDWNEASRKRDAAWFERHYADDVTEISSRTGTIKSKAEAIASVKTDKSTLESLELSETSVRVDGNMAVVTGVNRVKGRDEQGKAFDQRVRFTDTFIKRDGRWQVWATQGTVIP